MGAESARARPTIFWRWLLPLLLLATAAAAGSAPPASNGGGDYSVGVLAFRGEAHARVTWQPTVDHLAEAIPGSRFHLLPLTLEQMEQAVRDHAIDFLLTNPGNYVDLEYRYGISRLATLVRLRSNERDRGIASAVVVRADRSDLQRLPHLQGQHLMAVSEQAFGGFQLALLAMGQEGVDPFRDLASLQFAGFPQDDIVRAVLEGRVDAGVVRNCLVEEMASAGLLDRQKVRILPTALTAQQPGCEVTTPLYPDWPFAKLRHAPDALAKQVALALLGIDQEERPAIRGRYAGWTIPVEYQQVHQLFQALKIGPYAWMRQTPLQQLWERYWHWLLVLLSALAWGVWHMVRVEKLVRLRTAQLSESNHRLQLEMAERQQSEERLREQREQLAHVSRTGIAGELASGLAHELNQPLSAISSYAQACAWRLQRKHISSSEQLDLARRITAQVERAAAIIDRLRRFLRKETPPLGKVDLNATIEEACTLFAGEAHRQGVTLELELDWQSPCVHSETIQLQQVVINLLKNAGEAMQGLPQEKRTIQISTQATQQEHALVTIRDFGPGIDQAAQERLFEPFYTTRSSGMGIGLALSRTIVEAHGGSISVDADAGPGARFTIRIPLSESANAAA